MSWGRHPPRARPVPMAGRWRCEQVHGARLSPGRVLCKERRHCWPFVRMAGSLSGEGLHPRVCPCQGRLGRRETAGSRCGREQVRQSSSRTALPPQPPRCPRSRGASQGAARAALSTWLPSEKAEASPDSAHRAVWKRREECRPHPAFHLLARLAANSAPRRADLHAEPPPCSPDPGPIGLKSRLASSLSTYFIEENFCSCTWENGFLVRL